MKPDQMVYIANTMRECLTEDIITNDYSYVGIFYRRYENTYPTYAECQEGVDCLEYNLCHPVTIIAFGNSFNLYNLDEDVPQREIEYPQRVREFQRYAQRALEELEDNSYDER